MAYLDETYRIEAGTSGYYVMSAVVIESGQRDFVRDGIKGIVGGNYWHTTDALQTEVGRRTTCELLDYLNDPEGREVCLIAHQRRLAENDLRGEEARAACLKSLLGHLNGSGSPMGQVDLFVLEKRLNQSMVNRDAKTKDEAVQAGLVSKQARLFQISPADEALLWLPDLVCSAYRQQVTGRRRDLFDRVRDMCTILP